MPEQNKKNPEFFVSTILPFVVYSAEEFPFSVVTGIY